MPVDTVIVRRDLLQSVLNLLEREPTDGDRNYLAHQMGLLSVPLRDALRAQSADSTHALVLAELRKLVDMIERAAAAGLDVSSTGHIAVGDAFYAIRLAEGRS